MNIGIIVNFLKGGGAEKCAADLSIAFERYGYAVVFFTDLDYEAEYQYKGRLVNFSFNLNKDRELMSEKEAIEKKAEELKKLKIEYNIDVSISFMQFANYINIISKGSERVILTTHSVNSEYAKYDKSVFWSDHTFRELYQYADAITFPSEYCRKDWIEHYGDKNNITKVIYNPINIMSANEEDNKKNIVITIGRMQGVKRQWHIIRAFKKVNDKIKNSRLIILGDGELYTQLCELTEELGLKNSVDMPGNVVNVQDYLSQAKVFVLASKYESQSIAAAEALSAGVPVVSCDMPGGIREVLDISSAQQTDEGSIYGECGIIVPNIKDYNTDEMNAEEEEMANQILNLLENDKLRRYMGINGKKRAEVFSLNHIGNIWINEILKKKSDNKINMYEFEEAKEKSINTLSSNFQVNVKMYISYYRLLEKWMILHEKGIKVEYYFRKRGLKRIIIYGWGKMAKHLIVNLKNSSVHIVCAIDKRANAICDKFPIITSEDTIPDADCIIVTPIYDFEIIKNELMTKTQILVVSLEDVINGCN